MGVKNKLSIDMLGRRLGSGLKMHTSAGIWDLVVYKAQPEYKHGVMIGEAINCGVKPVLRKLSSLTEEDFQKMSNRLECFFSYDSVDNLFHLESDVLYSINEIPVSAYLYLIENHFWLDEPEGTFVYAEDLETNPY